MRVQEQAKAEEPHEPTISMKKVSRKRKTHEAAKLRIRSTDVSQTINTILLQNGTLRPPRAGQFWIALARIPTIGCPVGSIQVE